MAGHIPEALANYEAAINRGFDSHRGKAWTLAVLGRYREALVVAEGRGGSRGENGVREGVGGRGGGCWVWWGGGGRRGGVGGWGGVGARGVGGGEGRGGRGRGVLCGGRGKMFFGLGEIYSILSFYANNLVLRDGRARVAAAQGRTAEAITLYRALLTPGPGRSGPRCWTPGTSWPWPACSTGPGRAMPPASNTDDSSNTGRTRIRTCRNSQRHEGDWPDNQFDLFDATHNQAGTCSSAGSAISTVASKVIEAFSELEIKQFRSAFSSACRAPSASTPAGTTRCAVVSKCVNCVTRSTRSSVPVTSQSSEIQDNLDAFAIARNVRIKQSARAPTSNVSGDHRSPGPSNSAGDAD